MMLPAILDSMHRNFASTDSRLIQLRLQLLYGMLAYYLGQSAEAALHFSQVRVPLEEMGLKPDLWQCLRFLGWCWAKLDVPDEERQALTIQANLLLDEMTGTLSTPDQAIFLLNKWTADEEYIAVQIGQLVAQNEQMVRGSKLLRPWRRWQLMRRIERTHVSR